MVNDVVRAVSVGGVCVCGQWRGGLVGERRVFGVCGRLDSTEPAEGRRRATTQAATAQVRRQSVLGDTSIHS